MWGCPRVDNNDTHICIAPYGRNFRGADQIHPEMKLAKKKLDYINRLLEGR